MKSVLCYGDSNTWGFVPGSLDLATGYMERYPHHIRWTGQLQKRLGHNYLVIEEGLCGRNTNIGNPPDLGGESSNGKMYLPPCLLSHAPLDWVVLMLGSNDFKASLNRSVEEVALGLEELIKIIRSSTAGFGMKNSPQILLIAPPFLNTQQGMFSDIFKGASEKSTVLPALCENLAKKYDCEYLDMSLHMTMSEVDGLHIDENNQMLFSKFVYEKLLRENSDE